ncbi:ribosome silencing factor [Gallaecimonas pentaromativorans]|uniref:Ribosomal silencing factor RsfS n=1 Tax=Gallaecimonas pentaromativorans TaxID=584787 RepID=A0A3N1P3P3_9GAMM|nr:ribosome silencing factor [Gallaecimonas pentaromativorans]MED5525189.1 ribosome silencing factor [Pseudomonadota bacterium]ROQ25972.1 ribosome-associated protein [Gallaecimonas pentaromativorans]
MNGEQLKDFVVDKADDLKAVDIKTLDVRGKSSVCEFLVICSGTSRTHVNAIAENVVTEAKQTGMQPLGIEGKAGGEWVLVDLGDVVLHVMQEQTRDFYQLEKLWG